jgi:hypothetical protein
MKSMTKRNRIVRRKTKRFHKQSIVKHGVEVDEPFSPLKPHLAGGGKLGQSPQERRDSAIMIKRTS